MELNNESTPAVEQEFYKDSYESDGLTISIDEETDTISFNWDPDTHPKWNVIDQMGEEALRAVLCKQLSIALEEIADQTNED